MTATHPAFSLRDMAGAARAFPTGRPSLIAFVKEDCNTCNLAAPVLEAFYRAWGDVADIWMVGQTSDGNAILKDRHGLTLPILDDSALRASLAWGFEIVPAVYWTGPDGGPRAPLEGFVRAEWEALAQKIAADLKATPAAVKWADLPDWRPGCGSKHLDP
jgi:thiol-disulfide isomerase/thioredoxin